MFLERTDRSGAVVLSSILLTACASSEPESSPRSEPGEVSASLASGEPRGSVLLSNADGALNRFRSIGRFDGFSTCTAVLVASSPLPDAPAYVLTSGHCTRWSSNDVDRDLPADGMQVVFDYFVDSPEPRITVAARTIAYSTMKGRDLAVVELAATLGELAARGLTPFAIARSAPSAAPIRSYGIPIDGFEPEQAYLRREDCTASGRSDLLEFQWHFFDAWRNDCRDIFGGSSGSPVFLRNGEEVLALLNTTTVGGRFACWLGAPCEVTASGMQLLADRTYAVPIAGLSRCFDARGRFALEAGCPLDRGRQLALDGYPVSATRPLVPGPDGAPQRVTWNASLQGELAYYRYKTGVMSRANCRDSRGYGPVTALASDALIEDEIPTADGYYALCVVAGDSPRVDASWQPYRDATMVVAQIDTVPPVIPPQVEVQDFGDAEYWVQLYFELPELSRYQYKIGPPAETRCDDPAGYREFNRIPPRVQKRELPQRLCAIGYDNADNPTPPFDQVIEASPAAP